MNDDEIDDMFYENRKMNAPLCSTAWNFKQKCDRKCLRTGVDHGRVGWNTPDKVLLAILAIVSCLPVRIEPMDRSTGPQVLSCMRLSSPP